MHVTKKTICRGFRWAVALTLSSTVWNLSRDPVCVRACVRACVCVRVCVCCCVLKKIRFVVDQF